MDDGGVVRAVVFVPIHAATGAMLRYFVAEAKFRHGGATAVLRGLAMAVGVHGLYDFGLLAAVALPPDVIAGQRSLLTQAGGFVLHSLAVSVAALVWTVRAVRRLRKEQLDE